MALSPPTGLTVTIASTTQVDLAWTNGDVYDEVEVERKAEGGSYGNIAVLTPGGTDTYSDTTFTTNVRYYYRVRGATTGAVEATSAYCAEVNRAYWEETFAETLTLTDVMTPQATYTQTLTETLTLTDFLSTSQTLKTNYAYYLADAEGNVYEYDSTYLGDAGNAITSTWVSKRLDFSDQDPTAENRTKTVYRVRLYYKDITASTLVTVGLSTDGGATWITSSRTIGVGDGTDKTADFFFTKHGYLFNIKIENGSADADVQFTGLTLYYDSTGEYLEIS